MAVGGEDAGVAGAAMEDGAVIEGLGGWVRGRALSLLVDCDPFAWKWPWRGVPV